MYLRRQPTFAMVDAGVALAHTLRSSVIPGSQFAISHSDRILTNNISNQFANNFR
jgi:hypothetical protein